MSSSELKVVVYSEPLAELTIVDARYAIRAHGLGELQCDLPRGLYTIRSRAGDKTQEKMVRVRDEPLTVDFRVPVPPPDRTRTHEVMEAACAQVVAAAPALTPNPTARVVLALRATNVKERALLPPQSAQGFQLLSRTSTNPIEFGTLPPAQTLSGHTVWAVGVREGWYELSVPGDAGSKVCLPLFVTPRFLPTIIVDVPERSTSTGEVRLDLDRLLVSYDTRSLENFRDENRMRAMELARRSLVLGRNMLTPALMKVFFDQKHKDPILGLFAAYLLLADPDGQKYFEEVVHNTGAILKYPQHPDLVIARALGRQKGWWKRDAEAGDDQPLVAPPLLRASWDGMLTLKDRSAEVVATDKLRAIASTLIRSSVWVLWRPSSTGSGKTEAVAPRSSKRKGSPDALLTDLVERLRTHPELASTFRKEVISENYEGGKLARAIARTALELTNESDFKIPRGYSKSLANALSVPVPLITEGIRAISDVLGARIKNK